MDVLDSEDAPDYGCINNYGTASDKEDGIYLVEALVSTGVTEVETKYAVEVHHDIKYYSLSD